MISAVFLMPKKLFENIDTLLKSQGIKLNIINVKSLDELNIIRWNKIKLLVSFGTSIIVPSRIINFKDLVSINLHAGPPEYPGRDVHHFAIYNNEKHFGSTLHLMKNKVDEGEILYVKRFKILNTYTPIDLMSLSNKYGVELTLKFIKFFLKNNKTPKPKKIYWSKNKFTRKMFLELCKIEPDILQEEFDRRLKSVHMEGFNNIFTVIHNKKFFYRD